MAFLVPEKNNKEKFLIIHHTDDDGHAGGAIVYNYLIRQGNDKESIFNIETDYNFDTLISRIKEIGDTFRHIYIVDISFTLKTISTIGEIRDICSYITWFDHHASSLEVARNKKKYLNDLKIVYHITTKHCGAMIAFINLFPDLFPTETLKYIDMYDRWDFQMPDVEEFHYGFGTLIENPKDIRSLEWEGVLFNSTDTYVKRSIFVGKNILKFLDNEYATIRNAAMIIKDISIDDHNYRVAIINHPAGFSRLFGDEIDNVDFVMRFNLEKTFRYTYSLYSRKDNIHVGKICEYFGGGGHKGAAGFSSDKSPLELFNVKE
ncbi:MAG: DHHA1 domain-containing protein [Herbinix sp.]|nr:DHHA1 domain-containing protein [Herbinix sp.]